jgi:hypothetical protein
MVNVLKCQVNTAAWLSHRDALQRVGFVQNEFFLKLRVFLIGPNI